jgi:hypothetical protein
MHVGMGMSFVGGEMRKTVQGGRNTEWQPGMGMGFAGRGNEKDRTRNGSREWEWALRGGRNGNGRTRNDSLPLTALISSRDAQVLVIVTPGVLHPSPHKRISSRD